MSKVRPVVVIDHAEKGKGEIEKESARAPVHLIQPHRTKGSSSNATRLLLLDIIDSYT